MDIAALSISMSQSNLITQVGTAVLSMSLDTLEQSGDGMIDLINKSTHAMELSVQPNLGANIDIKI